MLSVKDPETRAEMLRAIDEAEQSDDAIDAESFAGGHQAGRMLAERLSDKAKAMCRQRENRRKRPKKSKVRNGNSADESEKQLTITQSDAVKIKQIFRRRDGLRKNLLSLIRSMANSLDSPLLHAVSQAIDLSITLVERLHSDLNISSITCPVSITIPKLNNPS